MPRKAVRPRQTLTIEWEPRHLSFCRVVMELRSGKVLLSLSPEAMSTTPLAQSEEEKKLFGTTVGGVAQQSKPTIIQTLQAYTRGYLWLCCAATVLILAAGILLFPQKTWNRVMMQLFGCITLNIRGRAYRFCEQPPAQQDHAGIPL